MTPITSKSVAPKTKTPISVGLTFFFTNFASGRESGTPGVRAGSEQFLGVAVCDDRLALGIEKDTVGLDG